MYFMNPIIMILIGLSVFIFLVVFVTGKGKLKPDYRTLFILGVVWLPFGIGTNNTPFSVIGFLFLALSLINFKKWNEYSWKHLDTPQRQMMIILMTLLFVFLFLGLFIYLYG